jgi:hypothetical protein
MAAVLAMMARERGAARGGKVTPVGAIGSKVRLARHPPRTHALQARLQSGQGVGAAPVRT